MALVKNEENITGCNNFIKINNNNNDNSVNNNILNKEKIEDVSKTFTNLLASSSLKGLLTETNTLSCQVQALEEETRNLIYDNHTEFVAAADLVTIAQAELIGTSTDRAEELQERTEAVLKGGAAVYNDFKETLKYFKTVTCLKSLFEDLGIVVRLPELMATHMQNNEQAEAVALFLKYKSFLQHHSNYENNSTVDKKQNIFFMKTLYEQSQNLFSQAATALKENHALTNHSTKLLLSAGTEDPAQLLQVWIVCRKKQLCIAIENHVKKISGGPEKLRTLATVLAEQLIPEVVNDTKEIHDTFNMFDLGILESHIQDFVIAVVNAICSSLTTECAFGEGYQCEELCLASADLRSSLAPLQMFSGVSSIFAEFLHNLAMSAIEARFLSCVKLYFSQYLLPLLEACNSSDPIANQRLSGERSEDPNETAIIALLDQVLKSVQAYTISLGTTIADCEQIISSLFGSAPTSGRQKLAEYMDNIIKHTVVSTLEAISLFLCEPNTPEMPENLTPCLIKEMRDMLRESVIGQTRQQAYSHIGLLVLVLILHWLKTHAIIKLRGLIAELFPERKDILSDLPQYCQEAAGKILAELANRWGRLIKHLLLHDQKNAVTSLNSSTTATINETNNNIPNPSKGAILAIQETVRAARVLKSFFLGSLQQSDALLSILTINNKVRTQYGLPSADRHLNWCCNNSRNSSLIDVERMLARRSATAAKSLPSLDWVATFIIIARVATRCILEEIRQQSFGLHRSRTLEIDLICLRDQFWLCLESSRDEQQQHENRQIIRFGTVPKRDAQEEKRQLRLVDILVEDTMMVLVNNGCYNESIRNNGTGRLLTSEEIRAGISSYNDFNLKK